MKEASQRAGMAPPESLEPPRKARTRRGVFEGDAAAVELRARLAQPRDGAPVPEARLYSPHGFSGALRYAGVLLMAAAAAGLAGYVLGGFGPQAGAPVVSMPPVGSPEAGPSQVASTEANAMPAPAAHLKPADRNAQLPAAQTAAIAIAPADARRTVGNASASRAVAPPPGSFPPPPVRDTAEIAAKMKLGADLMTSGDIASARTMFERVAEAGDAAGAFALAETYDPVVLGTLRLRGGITPDPALARRWYEKARDMGSTAALERIVRLTQNRR